MPAARKSTTPAPSPAPPHHRPLADRIRPASLSDYIGQAHLVGEGKPISQMVKTGQVHSLILWGPPGVGKTTLARLIAHETGRDFYELSAVNAGKEDIRQIVERVRAARAPKRDLFNMVGEGESTPSPVLFLDEIHRFNKAQQDFLLPYAEDGTIVLIGATTENPSFEIISALLSRTRVYVLESHTEADILRIIRRGAAELSITLDEDGEHFLTRYAAGDGRQALNLLESAASLYAGDTQALTAVQLREAAQSKHLRYDKAGDEHYNTVSAFIKSMRASHIDASLYYLARMVNAGEDPKFIARRMVIFASEDVGMADPHALTLANAVFRAVEVIGYPEAQINLAHGAAYLANAPKSRASYEAYFSALDDVKAQGNLPIPLKLRNAPTGLMRDLGYGTDYAHYGDEELLPEALKDRRYYQGEQQVRSRSE